MILELTLVVVSSPTALHRERLAASAAAAGFSTVFVERRKGESIALAVNAAVGASCGEQVAIIESDGWLSDNAGSVLSGHLESYPESRIVYTYQGVVGKRGRISHTSKPAYSPERLRNQFYWGDLIVYQRSLFDELGGLDASVPGAELYDFALKASRAIQAADVLPEPLFLTSSDVAPLLDAQAIGSTRTVLERHLSATGGGYVRAIGADGIHDTRRAVIGKPLISIVIPSRGIYNVINGVDRCYVIDAITSIMELSTYRNFEIVLVLDSAAEPTVVSELEALSGTQLRVVTWDKPFNFSEKINEGVLRAFGDYVLLLNDDVRVLDVDWLESLLALAQLPGAGMSGAMLYYEDDSIQHAGHAYFENDASHIGLDAARTDPGPLGGYRVEREVSGVTAACAMMPRSVYLEVGGMTSLLPGNFNDVDLCMKVTWLGYSIYWTPHAELYHFESKTRDASVHAFEVNVAWGRWGFRMHDPRYWPYPHNRPPA